MRLTPMVLLVSGRRNGVAWMAIGTVMRMATAVKGESDGEQRLLELPAAYIRQQVMIAGMN